MAQRFDIQASDFWFIGEDKNIRFDVVQDDGSTPQGMAGWSLLWELKAYPSSATPSISKTTGAGEIVISDGSGSDNRATVTIDDADTEPLEPGVYYHQLRRTDAGFDVILSFGDAHLRESGQ